MQYLIIHALLSRPLAWVWCYNVLTLADAFRVLRSQLRSFFLFLTHRAALCILKGTSGTRFFSCSSLHLWYLLKWLTHGRYGPFTGFLQHIYPLSSTHTHVLFILSFNCRWNILHMQNAFCPFMPIQGYYDTGFLSHSYIITYNLPQESSAYNMLLLFPFLDENFSSLYSLLPAKILSYVLLFSKTSWKIHLYSTSSAFMFLNVYFNLAFILPHLQKWP